MNSTRTNSHDARTMDILQQANEWILILESKEVSEHDRSEFKSWVESDRRHEDIYSQALAMKRALSELSLHDFDAELNKQMPRERALGLVAKIKVLRKKWPLWSTGFTAAVLLIGVVLFLPTLTVDENRTGTDSIQSIAVSTQVSETKSVTLDDGTVVTLAPESSINAKYTESNRQVILEKGQAFFDVIRDSSRPFSVASENLTVTVLGTAFDVRNSGTLQTVAVKEGTVEVKFPVIIDNKPISVLQKERIRAGQGVQATS
ncbi:MAG: FecR domain-containing protein, partial [Pseudomonadota bacterium]